ncbi:MAG: RNA polymerase sigma factor [Lachnospiraceae bacterium]|nr:RNA polymerase sigma factor [Lachnospiraceae bacterium]MBR5789138.1 RNA polymerase sigma factor [Lachnospiraceae bacterium]
MSKIDSNETISRLIKEYQNLIFSICLRHVGDYFVAEDLTQETFISAYTHLDTFDGENEKAYLARIASNKCIDYLRSAGRRMIATPEEEMPEESSERDELVNSVMNKEILANIQEVVDNLPPPYREVARLYFVEDRSAKEIAFEISTPLKTVQTRIYRARDLVKAKIRKEDLI